MNKFIAKLIILFMCSSTTAFSVPNHHRLYPSIYGQLRPTKPKIYYAFCYHGKCSSIKYFYARDFMVAETLIEGQVFLGWRPPCYPYCSWKSFSFEMTVQALEKQVKHRFPSAELREKMDISNTGNRAGIYSPIFK